MPELQTLDCLQPGLGTLERVKYFNRMMLTADDMRTDQDFVLQKLRRHNRFLHGWGVVCGLLVKAAPLPTQPWRVQVGEGYALGPLGDEIFVGEAVFLDLATCGPGSETNPCEPSLMLDRHAAGGPAVYVAIKYAECRSRPVLAMPGGCGCDDEACEYSRIRDAFSLQCLDDLPASHLPDPDAPTLCELASGKRLLACMPCPTEPWVVLAKVTLPGSTRTVLADASIDNRPPIRRLVFSTALIQQQMIACCCDHEGPTPPPPPQRDEATVEITKHASPLEFRDDATGIVVAVVSFEMKVTNFGPSTATNVRVRDRIGGIDPQFIVRVDQFTLDPSGAGAWGPSTPPDLDATLGGIAAGDAVTLGFRLVINPRGLRQDAVIENVATVATDTPLGPQSIEKAAVTVPLHRP